MRHKFLLANMFAVICLAAAPAPGQSVSPATLDEAARRTGLSREELVRQYEAATGKSAPDTAGAGAAATEPGRTSLRGIDDTNPTPHWRDTDAIVVLPYSRPDTAATAADAAVDSNLVGENATFGASFFHLDAGVFQPPSFGPVPDDYRLGVGDELVIHAWGEVDFQLTRVKLARMATLLTVSRQFTYAVGRLMDQGLGQMEASMVKLFTCRTAEWLTREAMQIHGGMGYAEETPVSRYFVDARVLSIFEGAEETLALKVITRSLIDAL